MAQKKKNISSTDWRGETLDMTDLIRNLHDKPGGQNLSDVTFLLSDRTELHAHKLILATASPYFEALFYGPLANNNNKHVQKIEVKDVEADVFRIIIQIIYHSGNFDIEVNGQDDKYIAVMEAADMYLLPNLFDVMATDLTECAKVGHWEDLLPHLDRVSQLPLYLYSEVYKDIKKWIIEKLPGELGQDVTFWEKLCPRVQADISEDLEKIEWKKDARECQIYIHLLCNIAFTGAPFTELIDKVNAKLSPLVQSFENKETFIKAMQKIIKLEGRKKKVNEVGIQLEVKTLLESKSWEELLQTAFGDVVNLMEYVMESTNETKLRCLHWNFQGTTELYWTPVVPSGYRGAPAPNWPILNYKTGKEVAKIYSNLLEFANKYSLPRLVDHCELLLMDCLFYQKINALSYVVWASGKKIFENMHKLGMFKVLLEFPLHCTSPNWMKLTESAMVFFRVNYRHFKLAEKYRVQDAIEAWCKGTSKDASEARDKYTRIWLNNMDMNCDD